MRTDNKEFLSVLCKVYMVFILCVLPLYTRGSYEQLGAVKYQIFRSVSALCLGVWAVVSAGYLMWEYIRNGVTKSLRKQWSMVDISMLSYGAIVIVSALLSPYKETAWVGYQDWYMGALSQLLFVAGYFCISRCYDNSRAIIGLGEVALLLVCVVGFLQRLSIDFLGLHKVFAEMSWERSHLLSTVGNINWLCGYLGVVAVLPVHKFLCCAKRGEGIWHYIVSVMSLSMLCIQGSDSGWLLFAVCIGVIFVWGRGETHCIQRSLWLTIGTILTFPCFAGLLRLRGCIQNMPVDGSVYERINWRGWWVILIALLLFLVVIRWRQGKQQKIKKKLYSVSFLFRMIWMLVFLGTVIIVLLMGADGSILTGEFWQEGRGALWKLSWKGFLEAPLLQKIFGAGPDCFAEYLQNGEGTSVVIHSTEHWAGAVFANAHNEWLNQLINLGLTGLICYSGIFVTAFRRYRGTLLGVLVVCMYLANALVSFQQVLNAPFLFLVIGICEQQRRKADFSI